MADEKEKPNLTVEDSTTTSKQVRLLPETKLLNIYRSLSQRVQEAKAELTKDIVSAKSEDEAGAIGADDTGGDANVQGGPTEVIIELETADEKIRTTYWGLELLYKTGGIDPTTHIYVIWLAVVSVAFCYNAWTMTLREAFPQYSTGDALTYWLIMDYLCDAVYLIDVFVVNVRIVYHNEDGLLIYDRASTRRRYFHSMNFKLDIIALTPLDVLYAIPQIGVHPLLRLFRLMKVHTFWECFQRVGNLMGSRTVVDMLKINIYIILIVHIYTCVYYVYSVNYEGVNPSNQFAYEGESAWPHVYARVFYINYKIATSVNSDKNLNTTVERFYMIVAWLICTFVVVVLLAIFRDMFQGLTKEEDDFSRKVHIALSYLKRYNCPAELENKVRSWFMYTRATQKVLEMKSTLAFLPRHIQTALALEINYKTLSKVSLFANCDRTVLTDLVVKLKPVLYLPGDYICRKGEIGKEMYIIVKGQAEVVSPEGKVFVTMTAGAVFGEISLLAVGGANRRTANVRSKGFSNLFILSKDDFEEIMKQYPLIYSRLKRRVAETLAKSNAAPPPPPPAAATILNAARKGGDDEQNTEVQKAPPKRAQTPKLLQLIRSILPNMPALRRIFRVHPTASPVELVGETITISDSVDAEIANLEWSTPSPEIFYVRTDAEQQYWDAPESLAGSAMDSYASVTESRSNTYISDESSVDSYSTVGDTTAANTIANSKSTTKSSNKSGEKDIVKKKAQSVKSAKTSASVRRQAGKQQPAATKKATSSTKPQDGT